MDSYFSVDVRDEPDATVLTVSGELDMASSPMLAQALHQFDSTQRSVILDLAGLEFIDVTGLHLLLEARERARRAGVELTVINASRGVRRLLKLTGTTKLLDGHDGR
jgi:anti-sigma B factor antagonist